VSSAQISARGAIGLDPYGPPAYTGVAAWRGLASHYQAERQYREDAGVAAAGFAVFTTS